MKQFYMLALLIVFGLSICNLKAQTIWTGPKITFTKANYADWTLEANQDRITDNVWITRQSGEGIFNIFNDAFYILDSPTDTEWAAGTTADIGSLTFTNWEDTVWANFGDVPSMVDQNMVVHLITDDIYIDIKFTSWTCCGDGGGFAYERSTDETLSITDLQQNNDVKLYPNPTTEFIQISGLRSNVPYVIYNLIGQEVDQGTISNLQKVNIERLTSGLYFIQLNNTNHIKFIKE